MAIEFSSLSGDPYPAYLFQTEWNDASGQTYGFQCRVFPSLAGQAALNDAQISAFEAMFTEMVQALAALPNVPGSTGWPSFFKIVESESTIYTHP